MSELHLESETDVKITPSALYNNLAQVGGLCVYGSKTETVLVKSQSARCLQPPSNVSVNLNDNVMALTSFPFCGKLLIFVTFPTVSHIWDLTKEVHIGIVSFTELRDNECARTLSVTVVEEGKVIVTVGTTFGNVYFFEMIGNDLKPLVGMKKSKNVHKAAVSCASGNPFISSGCVNKDIVAATGDVKGEILLWARTRDIIFQIPSHGGINDCVTGIVVDISFIVGAFGCGKIRFFSLKSGVLMVEIAAHARWINALSYEPVTRQIASCSDDGMICVWQLPENEQKLADTKLVNYANRKNALWTGCAFTEPGVLMSVAFDFDHMFRFRA
eukprot:Tbor_TRINITY_DN5886_c4_g17::TRINITY_DN5886_c4_g17_i1::g.6931::m.6931